MTIKTIADKRSKLLVNSSTAKTLVSYLISKGIKPKSLEDLLSLKLEALETPETQLAIPIYHKLWDFAVTSTQDQQLGLRLALNPYNQEMSLVSHVFFNSSTIKEGLKHYVRYYSLVNESIAITLSECNSKAMVSFTCIDDDLYCSYDIEHTLALAVVRVKEHLSHGDISLEEVHFKHASSQYRLYEKFFSCPVYFNQKSAALIFKSRYLDYSFPQKSSHLFHFLTNHLEKLLSKLKGEKSLVNQVAELIESELENGQFEANEIANTLCMSRQTLYRKLKQEGVSYHNLVDDIRKQKAISLLQGKQHTLSEIAFLIGFSELSSFSRAFKKWTGVSPAQYNKL